MKEIKGILERWRREDRALDEEIHFLMQHKFWFELRVKELVRDILLRRRAELQSIIDGAGAE